MGKNKTESIVSILFFIVGIAIIVLGVYLQISYVKFLETAIRTDATITDIDVSYSSDDTEHTVWVRFDANGTEITGILNEYNSGMHVGGTTTVFYDPTNPSNFKGSSTGFVGYIVIAFGAIFGLVGFIMIFTKIKKKSLFNHLKENGNIINAKIDDVIINRNYSVNGRNPYKVLASAEDGSGKVLQFESDNIWFNVKSIIDNKSIQNVKVYVDPNDSSKYFVDVQDLESYIGN